jgi:hypothetical protein
MSGTYCDAVSSPDIGLVLTVRVDLFKSEAGGRSRPIETGYRPICRFPDRYEHETVVGLCELELPEPLNPGTSGEGRLSFDAAVSGQVRSLISRGSRFVLAEGPNVIGAAHVLGIESDESWT